MKSILLTLTLTVIGATALTMSHSPLARKLSGKIIELSIAAKSENYSLGETLDLQIAIANNSEMPADLAFPSVEAGTLHVLVSTDGSTYREYVGPNWGNRARRGRTLGLEPGESFRTETTFLFNEKQETDHLTEYYAEQIRSKYLDTSFAIDKGGLYWIKARLVSDEMTLESEPISINISEPNGFDAAVWERIRMNGEYAYFLQTGDSRYRPDSEAEMKFIESMRELSADYPGSSFSQRFSDKLAKFEMVRSSLRNLVRSLNQAQR